MKNIYFQILYERTQNVHVVCAAHGRYVQRTPNDRVARSVCRLHCSVVFQLLMEIAMTRRVVVAWSRIFRNNFRWFLYLLHHIYYPLNTFRHTHTQPSAANAVAWRNFSFFLVRIASFLSLNILMLESFRNFAGGNLCSSSTCSCLFENLHTRSCGLHTAEQLNTVDDHRFDCMFNTSKYKRIWTESVAIAV